MKKIKLVLAIFLLLPINLFGVGKVSAAEDLREYQHGIDFVPKEDGNYYLIWSSEGNPPVPPPPSGNWTHDIYYSLINPASPSINPITTIISAPEAQEPASSAVATDGNIMITNEDGYNVKNEVGQRWGIYDNNLGPVKPYPNLIYDGGHSGHVAAVGNTFVVFWCNDWDDSVAGADGIGVGKYVLLNTFSSTGTALNSFNVQVTDATRDWWPLVAGSSDHALLLWQRYVNDQYSSLMYAVYDPATNSYVKGITQIATNLKYYTYDVQYYPGLDRFLVIGSYYNGGGFAYLIDDSGNIVAQNTSLPAIQRECQSARRDFSGYSLGVFPEYNGGVFVLKLTPTTIALNQTIADSYAWEYMGTDGIFTSSNSVYFASLSTTGIVTKTFTIDDGSSTGGSGSSGSGGSGTSGSGGSTADTTPPAIPTGFRIVN